MKRKAIIIAASPSSETPIPGVYGDLISWCEFLKSPQGGAWKKDELETLENQSVQAVSEVVKSHHGVDYSFVVFLGHGKMVKGDRPWEEMRLVLTEQDTATERNLNTGSKRCTIVLDCCRGYEDNGDSIGLIKEATLAELSSNSQIFRDAFDRATNAAEAGLVTIYSTQNGNDTPDGKSFSKYLISEAMIWTRKNQGVLHLPQAMELATTAMRRDRPQQVPEYQGGRRLRHFPLAVGVSS